jgi:hypothetical protein
VEQKSQKAARGSLSVFSSGQGDEAGAHLAPADAATVRNLALWVLLSKLPFKL